MIAPDKKQSQDASSKGEMSRSIKRTSSQALDILRRRELYQADNSFVSHDFKTSKKPSNRGVTIKTECLKSVLINYWS